MSVHYRDHSSLKCKMCILPCVAGCLGCASVSWQLYISNAGHNHHYHASSRVVSGLMYASMHWQPRGHLHSCFAMAFFVLLVVRLVVQVL